MAALVNENGAIRLIPTKTNKGTSVIRTYANRPDRSCDRATAAVERGNNRIVESNQETASATNKAAQEVENATSRIVDAERDVQQQSNVTAAGVAAANERIVE